MERLTSFFGLFAMVGIAWLLSSHRRKIHWRIVLGGIGLQFVFALLILKTDTGRFVFNSVGDFFNAVLVFSDKGAGFLFNIYPRGSENLPPVYTLMRSFAFGVLPTIIFFSSLMAILYHLGFMQRIVAVLAWVMRKTLKTSGAETLSAAANIFVGQTEAPLVIRPYVGRMTMSELNVVMVGGFATIAGGVFAAYVSFGVNAGHLLTASVISAPAALLIAKVMVPETEEPTTREDVDIPDETKSVNVLEAAAEGASAGVKLAINVGAMLIAFVALVAMGNALVGWAGSLCGFEGEAAWSLQKFFGYLFYPFAWLMGVDRGDCYVVGQLLGTKMVVNEFLAYGELGQIADGHDPRTLSERSQTIVTYALCGFANFSSIGIQLGGIGGIAPERRGDLAKLGLKAMFGGTLAAFMTACIAGVLL